MRRPTLVLILALAPLPGCLVTGTLDPGGGGRLTVKMRLVSVANFDTIKKYLQSPDVKLTNATLTPNKWATFELAFDDARKLSTAPALARQSVTLTEAGEGEQTLAIALSNDTPQQWSDAMRAYFNRELKMSLELPGEVTRSNATATTGQTVSWTWSLADLPARPRVDLTATFKTTATDKPTR